MQNSELAAAATELDRLESNPTAISPREAESVMLQALTPLLRSEGFTVQRAGRGRDEGVDFYGFKSPVDGSASVSIGIEYKHYTGPVGVEAVRALLGAAVVRSFDRALLITSSTYARGARELVRQTLPISIQLLDLPDLRSWISRVGRTATPKSRVIQAISDLSRRLAHFIADEPRSLQEIEWRDMERVLAEVFEGIGFKVELTPGSKDEGKDLVLSCRIAGDEHSYIIEVKHWRSGKKVGKKYISDFVGVVAREQRRAGVFVSSSGYTEEVEALTELERRDVKISGEQKIVALCQTYTKSISGIWSAPDALPEVLFAGTR